MFFENFTNPKVFNIASDGLQPVKIKSENKNLSILNFPKIWVFF